MIYKSKETCLFQLFYISDNRVFNNDRNSYHSLSIHYKIIFYFSYRTENISSRIKGKNTPKNNQRKSLDLLMQPPKASPFNATVNTISLNTFIHSKINIAFNQPYITTKIIPNYEYSINSKNHRAHLVSIIKIFVR